MPIPSKSRESPCASARASLSNPPAWRPGAPRPRPPCTISAEWVHLGAGVGAAVGVSVLRGQGVGLPTVKVSFWPGVRKKYDPKCNAHAACIELEHIEQETGRIIGSTCADYQNSIKTVCKPGDVMFGKLRPYLRKYAFVQKECVCSSEIWSLIPTDIVIPKYLFYLIQSEAFMKVANVSSGTKMPRAEWSTIAKSGYLIPSKDDQQATVDILETTDRIIASHVASYDRFIEYKKGLLQRLFI